jgi:hypothetical protein
VACSQTPGFERTRTQHVCATRVDSIVDAATTRSATARETHALRSVWHSFVAGLELTIGPRVQPYLTLAHERAHR